MPPGCDGYREGAFRRHLARGWPAAVYGGHVISLARALSFNGLANAQIGEINAGAHANPCFAGETVGAWSEVLEKAETAAPKASAR